MFEKLELQKYFTNQMFFTEYLEKEIFSSPRPDYFEVDCCSFLYTPVTFSIKSNVNYDVTHITNKKTTFAPDVIRCHSQKIPITRGTYKRIFFLGGCVWDYFCESVIINYIDGSVDEEKLFFYSFGDCSARDYVEYHYNICPNNTCKNVLNTMNKDEVGLTVYEFSLSIDLKKEIDSIILPDNDNMCIFAITVER